MSEKRKSVLFVGIGSPHGDDQAGWRIADALAGNNDTPADVEIRKAAVPLDVLHWLEDVGTLHLCDACLGGGSAGNVVRWERQGSVDRPHEFLGVPARLRSASSHSFGLTAVLELAARLGTLPQSVVVWGIEGQRFSPGDEFSPEIERRVPEIVTTIESELADARSLARAVADQTD